MTHPLMWLDDGMRLNVAHRVELARRWFDGCAFCGFELAIVTRKRHDVECPFAYEMALANVRYVLHEMGGGCSETPEAGET